MTKPIDIDALVAEIDALYYEATPEDGMVGLLAKLHRHWPAIRDELQRLAQTERPTAEYVTHRGGNYGSPVYRCSECKAENMVDEYSPDTAFIDQIKHKDSCSYIGKVRVEDA